MKRRIVNFIDESQDWTTTIIGSIAVLLIFLVLVFIVLFLLVASLSIILGFYGSIAGGLLWICYHIWAALFTGCALL